MNTEKKGYWLYSIVAITCGVGLFGYVAYLIYDLIIKLSVKDFSNNTVIQALITLITTVFIGGYFSKWLEHKNLKKIELYKIQTSMSLKIIDLGSILLRHKENLTAREMLIDESIKVKLYFPDSVLKSINEFIESNDENSVLKYNIMINELRKNIR